VGEDHSHSWLGAFKPFSPFICLKCLLTDRFHQTRVEGIIEAAEASNVKLSQEELDEIREVINSARIVGGRYNAHAEGALAK
jgi:hypothetical protein